MGLPSAGFGMTRANTLRSSCTPTSDVAEVKHTGIR